MGATIPKTFLEVFPQRKMEVDKIEGAAILEFLQKIPEKGLFFHGGRAKYATEKTDNGLQWESNAYFHLRKPSEADLQNPITKARDIDTVRSMFAHLYAYAGDSGSPMAGRHEHNLRVKQLQNQSKDPFLAENFYQGTEGAQYLPVIFVAQVPDSFVDPYPQEPAGLTSIITVHQFPISPENFVAIEALDFSEVNLDSPAALLTKKIFNALEKQETTEQVRAAAKSRFKRMGLLT